MNKIDSWIGGAGEDSAASLVSLGGYVFAALFTTPAIVVKLDPSDMSEVDRWTGTADEGALYMISLTQDGTYLYVSCERYLPDWDITTWEITKLDPSDMSVVDQWYDPGPGAPEVPILGMTCMGGYLYACTGNIPGRIHKIDTSDGSIDDTYIAGAGDESFYCITNDGTYVYAGNQQDPGFVVKIDPSDMSEADRWTGAAGESPIFAIAYDGGYVFAGCAPDGNPGIVKKIDISDMSEADEWEGAAGEEYVMGMYHDGTSLYFGLCTDPAIVIKLDPSDMSEQDRWEGEADEPCAWGMTGDGTYVYAGLDASPAQVIQLQEVPLFFTLTINIVGTGSVTKNPAGVTFPPDTPVELTAEPGEGWGFSEWSGDLTGSENPKVITMDGDKTVTATFTALYQYTITTYIIGRGTITKNPSKPTYDPGEVVELTAVPNDSYFVVWSGDLSGTVNPKNITVDSDKSVTAAFSQEKVAGTYTAPSGQAFVTALDGDSDHLYTAMGSVIAYLKKISKSTMEAVDSITGVDLWEPYGMLYDGSHVYFSHRYKEANYPFHNARVAKIQIDPFQAIDHWWGGVGSWMYDPGYKSLAYDAAYLYFGVVYRNTSRVVKLLKADMSLDSHWTNDIEDSANYGPCIYHDGTYLYAGIEPIPGTPYYYTGLIYKLDPGTMIKLSTWTGATGEYAPFEITGDGTYIYVVLYTSPVKVVKIDPSDMTTVSVWTGEPGQNLGRTLCVTGGKIYVGLWTEPAQVVEIDAATMVTTQTWVGETDIDHVTALTPDFIYTGLSTNPGKVVKLFFPLGTSSERSWGTEFRGFQR